MHTTLLLAEIGMEFYFLFIILAVIVLIVLSIYLRGPLGTICRVAVFLGSMAVIIAGAAILMNNVSLAGPPNPAVRLHRFLTMNWAATITVSIPGKV